MGCWGGAAGHCTAPQPRRWAPAGVQGTGTAGVCHRDRARLLARLRSRASCTRSFSCAWGSCTLRTQAGERTRVHTHTHTCQLLLALPGLSAPGGGHARTPSACPRPHADVKARVHARAAQRGRAHAHARGCPRTQPCALLSPAGSARRPRIFPLPAGDDSRRAEEAVTQSWIPASPHPPAGPCHRAATWSPWPRCSGAGHQAAGSGAGVRTPCPGPLHPCRVLCGPGGSVAPALPGRVRGRRQLRALGVAPRTP